MCLGRERKAQLSLPSNTYATSILVIMQAGDGSVAPGLNGTACLLSIWLSACFPKRGWPHSHCPLGAVPGPCCPLNPAQPLCGKLLAGRSRSCAREQADNGAARAGGVHPPADRTLFMSLFPSLAASLNHVFRFPITYIL